MFNEVLVDSSSAAVKMYRKGVATCTHVHTCVPEKMSKVKKKNETKQNNRNIKQTGN